MEPEDDEQMEDQKGCDKPEGRIPKEFLDGYRQGVIDTMLDKLEKKKEVQQEDDEGTIDDETED